MKRDLSPDDVLPRLPQAWRSATWRPLDGGLSNRNWLLEYEDRKAVLKIDESPRQPPFNTRHQEALVQAVAADRGLANVVLHAGDQVYLTEYVEGTVWQASSFNDAENLRDLAMVLRRLHAMPPTGRLFDSRSAATGYAATIKQEGEAVERCLGIVEALPEPQHRCCCHNDLVAENILSAPGIRFLDWEYACDNDPLFDLATIVEHHQLHEQQVGILLNAYFNGDGERWRARLVEQRRHYAALLWLWAASRSAHSAEK
jgi:thiamine kinase-like enzyme